mgnify:CR=1 FL=1
MSEKTVLQSDSGRLKFTHFFSPKNATFPNMLWLRGYPLQDRRTKPKYFCLILVRSCLNFR